MTVGWNRRKSRIKSKPKYAHHNGEYSKTWILSIPKIINENECWIPLNIKPNNKGYCRVVIDFKEYLVHRIVMCLYYNIDYKESNIVTMHNRNCSRACFNPNHLKPGSDSTNLKDAKRWKKEDEAQSISSK